MTFTPRDAKDVSTLVAKKLEYYMNVERREERFNPQGCYPTTSKMQSLDLMYHMINSAEIDYKKKSHHEEQKHTEKSHRHHRHKSPRSKKYEHSKKETNDESKKSAEADHGEEDSQKEEGKESSHHKSEKVPIKPKLVTNSRRVVTRHEAERLKEIANKVYSEQDIDKLHVLHRYRPFSNDVAPVTENGKVANYVMHVGSALHSKNYVEFYMKEGLQHGNKEYSKRLQRLAGKKGSNDQVKSKSQQPVHPSVKQDNKQSVSKTSRMQEILGVTSARRSGSESTTELPPIDADQPVYSSYLSSAPHSSRASVGHNSKNTPYDPHRPVPINPGYRMIVDDDRSSRDDVSTVRQESRARMGSCEDYSKFPAINNDSFSGPASPREFREEDFIDESFTSRSGGALNIDQVEIKYKRFPKQMKSVSEESLAGSSTMRGEGQGAQSWQGSQASSSPRSRISVNPTPLTPREEKGHRLLLIPSDDDQSIRSEAGSMITSSSASTLTPGRSRLRPVEREPIMMVVNSPEIPRLGITSSLNDSIAKCSSVCSETQREEYLTSECQEKADPDTRAVEDKVVNSSQTRAEEERDISGDQRAEVNQNYIEIQEAVSSEHIVTSVPPLATEENYSVTQTADGDQHKGEGSEQNNGDNNNGGNQEKNSQVSSEQEEEQKGDSKEADNPESSRSRKKGRPSELTKKNSLKSIVSLPEGGRSSNISNSRPASSASGKGRRSRANEMEGLDSERGEDEIRDTQLDRGNVPEVDPRQKNKVERGDDTPRTPTSDRPSRLTPSAKQRGRSDYVTMEDNERGLEKEYFQPVANEQEMYVCAEDQLQEDSELCTPQSTRPSSASSAISKSSAGSKGTEKKQKSSRSSSKVSAEKILGQGSTRQNENRPQSSESQRMDGRGDDSNSVKNAALMEKSGQEAGDYNGSVRAKQDCNGKNGAASKNSQFRRPNSASSRGSINDKEKVGQGQGYAVDKEIVSRGLEGSLHQQGSKLDTSVGKKGVPDLELAGDDESQHDYIFSPRDSVNGSARDSIKSSGRDSVKGFAREDVKRSAKDSVKDSAQDSIKGSARDSVKGSARNNSQVNISQTSVNKSQHEQKASSREYSQHAMPVTSKAESQRERHTSKMDQSLDKNEEVENPLTTKMSDQSLTSNKLDKEAEQKLEVIRLDQPDPHLTHNISSSGEITKSGETSKANENVEHLQYSLTEDDKMEDDQKMPTQDKGFVEAESSEIIKGAVSSSASLEKVLPNDSQTVLDFRPLSASTAKSVGGDDYELPRQTLKIQPSKIVEVTEVEDTHHMTPKGYQARYHPNRSDPVHVPHPSERALKKTISQGQIINLAEIKPDTSVHTDASVEHPSVRRRSSASEKKSISSKEKLEEEMASLVSDMGNINKNGVSDNENLKENTPLVEGSGSPTRPSVEIIEKLPQKASDSTKPLLPAGKTERPQSASGSVKPPLPPRPSSASRQRPSSAGKQSRMPLSQSDLGPSQSVQSVEVVASNELREMVSLEQNGKLVSTQIEVSNDQHEKEKMTMEATVSDEPKEIPPLKEPSMADDTKTKQITSVPAKQNELKSSQAIVMNDHTGVVSNTEAISVEHKEPQSNEVVIVDEQKETTQDQVAESTTPKETIEALQPQKDAQDQEPSNEVQVEPEPTEASSEKLAAATEEVTLDPQTIIQKSEVEVTAEHKSVTKPSKESIQFTPKEKEQSVPDAAKLQPETNSDVTQITTDIVVQRNCATRELALPSDPTPTIISTPVTEVAKQELKLKSDADEDIQVSSLKTKSETQHTETLTASEKLAAIQSQEEKTIYRAPEVNTIKTPMEAGSQESEPSQNNAVVSDDGAMDTAAKSSQPVTDTYEPTEADKESKVIQESEIISDVIASPERPSQDRPLITSPEKTSSLPSSMEKAATKKAFDGQVACNESQSASAKESIVDNIVSDGSMSVGLPPTSDQSVPSKGQVSEDQGLYQASALPEDGLKLEVKTQTQAAESTKISPPETRVNTDITADRPASASSKKSISEQEQDNNTSKPLIEQATVELKAAAEVKALHSEIKLDSDKLSPAQPSASKQQSETEKEITAQTTKTVSNIAPEYKEHVNAQAEELALKKEAVSDPQVVTQHETVGETELQSTSPATIQTTPVTDTSPKENIPESFPILPSEVIIKEEVPAKSVVEEPNVLSEHSEEPVIEKEKQACIQEVPVSKDEDEKKPLPERPASASSKKSAKETEKQDELNSVGEISTVSDTVESPPAVSSDTVVETPVSAVDQAPISKDAPSESEGDIAPQENSRVSVSEAVKAIEAKLEGSNQISSPNSKTKAEENYEKVTGISGQRPPSVSSKKSNTEVGTELEKNNKPQNGSQETKEETPKDEQIVVKDCSLSESTPVNCDTNKVESVKPLEAEQTSAESREPARFIPETVADEVQTSSSVTAEVQAIQQYEKQIETEVQAPVTVPVEKVVSTEAPDKKQEPASETVPSESATDHMKQEPISGTVSGPSLDVAAGKAIAEMAGAGQQNDVNSQETADSKTGTESLPVTSTIGVHGDTEKAVAEQTASNAEVETVPEDIGKTKKETETSQANPILTPATVEPATEDEKVLGTPGS